MVVAEILTLLIPLPHSAVSKMAAATAAVSLNCKIVPAAKLKAPPCIAAESASTCAGVTKPAIGLKLATPAAAKFPTAVAVAVKLAAARSLLESEI